MQENNTIIIEDGRIFYPDEIKGFDPTKKEYYLIKRDGVNVFDLDKYKVRPFVKDILNRQHQFIEIKYLFIILLLGIFSIGAIMITFLFTPGKSYIQNQILTMQNVILKKIDESKVVIPPIQTISEAGTQTNIVNGNINDKEIIHYNIPTNKKIDNGGL